MFIFQVISASWLFWIHVIFNDVNSRNDYHLFRVWLKMSNELPVKSDRDYRTIGLSRVENKKFWMAEDRFNHLYYRLINVALPFICVIVSGQIFVCPNILHATEKDKRIFCK